MRYYQRLCLLAIPAVCSLISCGRYATDSAVQSLSEADAARMDELQALIERQQGQIDELKGQVIALQEQMAVTATPEQVAWIDAVSQGLSPSVDDAAVLTRLEVSGVDLLVEGANLTVRNAQHDTSIVDGTGNVIIGWNETDGQPVRTGSHNLVLGDQNSYTSYGAIVSGEGNTASGANVVVLGGSANTASGVGSCVIGGSGGLASGMSAALLGGASNQALGPRSTVTGGSGNRAGEATETDEASGAQHVCGGADNHAMGAYAVVAGGNANWVYASYASISGGYGNRITSGAENAVLTCGTGVDLTEPNTCSEDL